MNWLDRPYFKEASEAASLAVFRVLFGLLMFISVIRFWLNGWIEKLYLEPTFHFTYYGFEWVQPLGSWTYLIFALCAISALMVMLGYKYKWGIALFFFSFTYIELMDKTTYLNHYYFVSLLSFMLMFLPAHCYFSIDARQKKQLAFQYIPKWNIDALKLIVGIVYFYAGLAKLNSDWLFKAMPLSIWLQGNYDLPFLGSLLQLQWTHYGLSWGGALYDLAIPFLLLYSRTRWFGFVLVVVFHSLTSILFPIGMFPYLMIASSLIFFSPKFHHSVLGTISSRFNIAKTYYDNGLTKLNFFAFTYQAKLVLFGGFFMIQLLMPFRHLLYPGELFWTEEGFRFSWRVMLMEKAGSTTFKIVDRETGKRFYVDNREFLTSFQEKQMSFQPDFILEYAHYLARIFEARLGHEVSVFADSFVALNGRTSRRYIDEKRDLTQEFESFFHKDWILPFEDEIKGF